MHATTSRSIKAAALCAGLLLCAGAVFAVPITPRANHTATLLPTGDVVIIGGQSGQAPATALTSVQFRSSNGGGYIDVAPLPGGVARTSHTATLLPTGDILVAGGVNGGGTVNTFAVYSTRFNCWSPVGATTLNNGNGRHSHTATLLKDPIQGGKVLLCGGYDNAGNITNTCDIYTPGAQMAAGCGTALGALATGPAAPVMTTARAAFTANLLPDGRVFMAGGVGQPCAIVAPGVCSGSLFDVTNEVYNPANPLATAFTAAHSLITERGFHNATVVGNGKVLIFGGQNNKDDQSSRGFIGSAELYDPVADAIAPAGPMSARKARTTGILSNDGTVHLYGGLGNVTTTYIGANAFATLDGASFVTVNPAGGALTGGSVSVSVTAALGTPVTGIVESGEILMSSPTVNFTNGQISFTPGQDLPPTTGLRQNLVGTRIFCSPSSGVCGQISRDIPFANLQGLAGFSPFASALGGGVQIVGGSGSSIGFGAGPLTNVSGALTLNGVGSFTPQSNVTVVFPTEYLGANISGTIALTAGTIVQNSSFTISLTGATGVVPSTLVTMVGGAPTASFPITFTAPAGTISWNGVVPTQSFATPVTPGTYLSGSGAATPATISGLSGVVHIVADKVDLSTKTFNVDVATIVINAMDFADEEVYTPSTNLWAINTLAQDYGGYRFNATETELPSGAPLIIGGLSCPDPGFNPLAPQQGPQGNCGGNIESAVPNTVITGLPNGEADFYISPFLLGNWFAAGSLNASRANHSSTLLPDGTILFAGGSQGPSILNSGETFEPVTRTTTLTKGFMSTPRDLHTATLMTNGRVLLAGGFSTNALSTGPTATAEIYYPDTRVFLPTSPMGTARDQHTAVLLADGRVMVAGGYAGGAYLNSVEIYSSTAATWNAAAPMNVARAQHSATLLPDGRVLVTMGINASGVLNTFEIYNPDTNGWTAATVWGGPANGLHSHRTTVLLNGTVLLTGGDDGFGETNSSFIFDPKAPLGASWSATQATMKTKRLNHTAVLLPNGVVVAAGGTRASLQSLASVETFDPGSGSWTNTASFATTRGFHTVTLTKDGTLFAVGGVNNGTPLNTIEALPFESPDLQSVGFPPSVRVSTIAAIDLSPFDRGNLVNLKGLRFQGNTEANSGNTNGSSFYSPRIVLQAIDGSGGTGSQGSSGFGLDLTTAIYANANNLWTLTDTSMTIQMPAYNGPVPAPFGGTYLPYGWYQLRTNSSAEFSSSRLVQAGPPKPGALASPPVGSAIGANSITWTWGAATGGPLFGTPQGYDLYSSTSGILVATSAPASLSFTTTGLAPNTTASISVAGFTLSGDGPLSASATYFTLAVPPALASVASVTFNSVMVQWSQNGNSQGTLYEVSVSTDNPAPGGNGQAPFTTSFSTPITTLQGVTTNFAVVPFLTANTTYSFRVQAYNGSGFPSGFSNVVSTRTRIPITGITGTAQDTVSILWNWNNTVPPLVPGNGEFFKVYFATVPGVFITTGNPVYLDVVGSTNTQRSILVSVLTPAGEGPLAAGPTVFTLSAVPAAVFPPISATSLSTGSLTAIWGANGNPAITNYNTVLTGLAGAGPSSTNTATSLFATFTGLAPPASLFDIRVNSVNGDGKASLPLIIGTTSTWANPPINLAIAGSNATSITVNWSANNNSSSATYEVLYTTAPIFGTSADKIAVPFSLNSNVTTATISGLVTGTTYSIEVLAQNLFGVVTVPSNIITTSPFNGGGPPGTIGGVILPGQNNEFSGFVSSATPRFVDLVIPVGALPPGTFVTLSSQPIAPSPCGPIGTQETPIAISIVTTPPTQPTAPIFLTVGYTAAEVAGFNLAQVALQRVDLTGACVPLGTTFDQAHNLMTAQVNHFTAFQAGTVLASASPDNTLIFPNPFYPSRGQGYVTFAQMPAFSHVRLYTHRGELVKEDYANGSGLWIWGGTNLSGRSVASGVYMAVVEAGDSKRIFKVVVLR